MNVCECRTSGHHVDTPQKHVRLIRVRRFPVLIAFVAVAVGLAVPASALLTCMNGQANHTMAQMACCKTAKPVCEHHPAASVKCCKTGDHREPQNFAKVPTVTDPVKGHALVGMLVSTTNAVLPFFTRQQVRPPLALYGGTTSPPHLAFSALLI